MARDIETPIVNRALGLLVSGNKSHITVQYLQNHSPDVAGRQKDTDVSANRSFVSQSLARSPSEKSTSSLYTHYDTNCRTNNHTKLTR